MKIRNLFVGMAAALFAFAACQEQEQNLGVPDISLSTTEMTFEIAGGDQELILNATRDWKVETEADWVVVSPESGSASAEDQKVTVSVLENDGMDRTADLKFTIGMKSKYLTVSQAGPGGSAEALMIYANDMDNGKVEKVNDYWPYPDQSDSWRNEKGTGIANVAYASNGVSIRSVSSTNNIWFPAKGGSYFSIQNIALNGTTSLQLSFRAVHGSPNGYKKDFSADAFKVFVSKDASKWVELPYELSVKAENEFDEATAKFSVADVEALSVTFQFLGAEDGYRLTDIDLSVFKGEGAVAVDFAHATEMDFSAGGSTGGDTPAGEPTTLVEATIAEFLAASESTDTWYKLTGEIISIAKEDYGNFTIKDATGEVYIYGMTSKWVGSNDKSFSQIGLKVGDTVTLGTLRGSYNGTPQGGGNKVPAYYISHVAGEGGETPGEDQPSEEPTNLVEATIAEFLAASESTDTWYKLTGEIVSLEAGNKYGNFTIKDATGEVYIYGMTSKWVGSNDQSFESLGLKVTDVVTLGTLRGSYNGTPQGGGNKVPAYYISHTEGAGLPADPAGTVVLTFPGDTQESAGSYTSDWSTTIGDNSWQIVNFNNNNNKWAYIKCGHKSSDHVSTITTKNHLSGKISKVSVTVDKLIDASKVTSKLEVASDAAFSSVIETVEVAVAKGTLEYAVANPAADLYYRLTFDNKALGGDTNGNVQISQVKYLAAE